MKERELDAVLIYAKTDKRFVEKMATWLEEKAGMRIWLDQWHLIPGNNRLQATAAALAQSKSCLVVVGQDIAGVLSPELCRILEQQMDEGLRIIPVLLPGTKRSLGESHLPPFLRRLAWVEFPDHWQEEDFQQWPLFPDERAASIVDRTCCPFRGLEVFREEDRPFFFGREALVQRMRGHLSGEHFLAVLGPSGCGKSSAVQAGLIPQLRDTGALVTVFTPGAHPMEEMAFALRVLEREHGPCMPTESLLDRLTHSEQSLHFMARELLERVGSRRLFLVIDQFEELFTQIADPGEQKAFITSLLFAMERGSLSVVLTMRSDFIGKCVLFPELNAHLNDHLIQIEALTGADLRRALEEPARLVGLRFQKGLVDRIIGDLEGAPGEMPLLGYALLELYKRREGPDLTLEAYQTIGGIEGALAQRAEREFQMLDARRQDMLRRICILCLVQPGEGAEDTRRRASLEEILAIGSDDAVAEDLVRQWTNARLLTTHHDAIRQTVWVDVAHEAMIRKWPRIQAWMAADRDAARLVGKCRRAAREWRQAGRHPDYLLQGAPLVQLEELDSNHRRDLTEPERDFLRASLRKRERGKWMRRGIAVILAVLSLVAVSAAWVVNRLRDQALVEARTAQEVVDFMVDLFEISDPNESRGNTVTAREILDKGALEIEEKLSNEPLIQARLMSTMGDVYQNLGLYQHAIPLHEKALALWRQVFGNSHIQVAEGQNKLGACLIKLGNCEKGELLLRKALFIRRNTLGNHHPEVASSLNLLGNVSLIMGKHHDARDYLEEAIKIQTEQLGDSHQQMAESLNDLAYIYMVEGNFLKAEPCIRKTLQIDLESTGEEHLSVALSFNNHGRALMEIGDYANGEIQLKRSIAIYTKLLGENSLRGTSPTLNLGELYRRKGNLLEAKALVKSAVDLRSKQQGQDHPGVARAQVYLARVFRDEGSYREADDLLVKSTHIFQKVFNPKHTSYLQTQFQLADLLREKGSFEEAESLIKKIIEIQVSKNDNGYWNQPLHLNLLGACLVELGRYEEAEPLLLASHDDLLARTGEKSPYVREARQRLARLYRQWRQPRKAAIYASLLGPREAGSGGK